jgi:hypothetical protein
MGARIDGFRQNLAVVGSAASGTIRTLSAVWNGFRGTVEVGGAAISAALAVVALAWSGLVRAAGSVGLASENAVQTAVESADRFRDLAAQFSSSAKQHWGEAGQALAGFADQQAQAGQAGATAAEAASGAMATEAGAQADLTRALDGGAQAAGKAATSTEGLGTATGGAGEKATQAADGIRAFTAGLAAQKDAAKDAVSALEGVAQAQQALNQAQDQAAGKEPAGRWEDAAMGAAKAAGQLNSGNAAGALATMQEAYATLQRAVEGGDTSAMLQAVQGQLDQLALKAQKALGAVASVAGGGPQLAGAPQPGAAGGVSGTAQADALRRAYADTGRSVQDADRAIADMQRRASKAPVATAPGADTATGTGAAAAPGLGSEPIKLSFDVAESAAAAGKEVAAAILAAVQEALAGANLSVPVKAIVSVGDGSEGDLGDEALKRGRMMP